MLSTEKNYVNDLLNNDRFIAWVTSNYKTDNAYWQHIKTTLNKADSIEFNKAVTVLTKLKTLHIDDDKSVKSPEFIKEQYSYLMKDYHHKSLQKPKIFKLNKFLKYAAILIILISISGILFLSNKPNNTFASHLTETTFNTSDLLIQTPDNKYYKILENENRKWLNDDGVFVNVNSESIRFTASKEFKNTKNPSPYKIIIPEGKKYLLTLIDNTSIELNSNTSLSFTNSTTSKNRFVNLKGEAFFDVTHNKNRPFIVQSSDLKIKVLGTEFNVSNYENNGYTSTTLIDGSIDVSNQQGENTIIKPGNQARLYNNQSNIIVKKVNVQKAVSWTTNRMIFKDETLENITQKLNKWYQVEFILKDKNIRQYRFTGTLKKENTLTHFLQMLRYTQGISYKISGDKVTLFFE